jgi:hypothetical protein
MKVMFCVRQPGHHFRCSQTHTRGFGIDEGWPGLGYDSLYSLFVILVHPTWKLYEIH